MQVVHVKTARRVLMEFQVLSAHVVQALPAQIAKQVSLSRDDDDGDDDDDGGGGDDDDGDDDDEPIRHLLFFNSHLVNSVCCMHYL